MCCVASVPTTAIMDPSQAHIYCGVGWRYIIPHSNNPEEFFVKNREESRGKSHKKSNIIDIASNIAFFENIVISETTETLINGVIVAVLGRK